MKNLIKKSAKNVFDLSKNTIIFYHANCLDGFASAYVAHKKFKNKAEYIPLSYKNENTKKGIIEGEGISIKSLADKEVYFLDFCPSKSELEKIKSISRKMVILDHHVGVQDLVLSFQGSRFGETEKGESGAFVASQYFFPKEKVSSFIRYISAGDTWFFGSQKFEKETLSFIHTLSFDFKTFGKVEKDFEDKSKLKNIQNIGKVLLEQYRMQVDGHLTKAKKIDFDGYKVYAVNASSIFKSELGKKMAEKTGLFGIVYYFEEGILKLSFRSAGKVDVSEIAKKYGGGGHRNAAATFLQNENLIREFINKIVSK